MIQRNQKSYSIGDIAQISGLSISTLRYYDSKKLLVPELRNPDSRYRYYSESQILTALFIRELRLRNISLQEMTEILNATSLTTMNRILEQKKISIEHEIMELNKSKKLVETSRQVLSGVLEKTPVSENTNQIKVSEFPVYHCFYSDNNSRISVQEIFWDRFSELYRLLDQSGYLQTAPIMAVFHEHYTHQFFFEEGHMEVLAPIDEYDEKNPNMKKFGGFLTANITAHGHYKNILPQYVQLVHWIEENQYEIIGDPIEIYMVEFTQTSNSDEYVTEIHFPIRKLN